MKNELSNLIKLHSAQNDVCLLHTSLRFNGGESVQAYQKVWRRVRCRLVYNKKDAAIQDK